MTQRKITEELKYQLYRFKKFKYRFILVHWKLPTFHLPAFCNNSELIPKVRLLIYS